jgi:hypothetical protein
MPSHNTKPLTPSSEELNALSFNLNIISISTSSNLLVKIGSLCKAVLRLQRLYCIELNEALKKHRFGTLRRHYSKVHLT